MSQSRQSSAIEAVANVAIGMAVSWLVTYYVLPVWGLKPSPVDAAAITLVYSIVSFARSYALRRTFNLLARLGVLP